MASDDLIGVDLAKHGRDALYGIGGVFMFACFVLTWVHPLLGLALPVALFPLTGALLYGAHWVRRTGPVVVTATGLDVGQPKRSLGWSDIAEVKARPPAFLHLTTLQGELLRLYVGSDPQVVEGLVRGQMVATLPALPAYRGEA